MNVQPKTPARRQPPPRRPRFQLPRFTLPERLSSGFTPFLVAYGGFLLATGGGVRNFSKLFARMAPPLAIGSFPLDLWGVVADGPEHGNSALSS
jgi:hypothetical protein